MRLPDWQLRFSEFVSARQNMPFAWGRNDCCVFAAEAIKAITGQDHAAEFRGIYRTVKTADRLMNEMGGLEAIASRFLGDPVSPKMAAVGDIVMTGNTLGVCNGSTIIGPGKDGIAVIPMAEALKAWKV